MHVQAALARVVGLISLLGTTQQLYEAMVLPTPAHPRLKRHPHGPQGTCACCGCSIVDEWRKPHQRPRQGHGRSK